MRVGGIGSSFQQITMFGSTPAKYSASRIDSKIYTVQLKSTVYLSPVGKWQYSIRVCLPASPCLHPPSLLSYVLHTTYTKHCARCWRHSSEEDTRLEHETQAKMAIVHALCYRCHGGTLRMCSNMGQKEGRAMAVE